MKRKLLICTILRNQRHNVDRWLRQIMQLTMLIQDEYEVEVAAYENDSTDGTVEKLSEVMANAWTQRGFSIHSHSQTLGTRQYGSVWDVARIKQLAAARNQCLAIAETMDGKLAQFDKVAYVEVDVSYDPEWCKELVLARHPAAAGLPEPDVYSGWSLRTERNPKESVFLYDCCATRATSRDVTWDFTEQGGKWRGQSVVPTDLGGHDAMCLHKVWSTFNGFCVYNATPFKKGLRWGYVNRRIDPSGIWIEDGDIGSGWLETDTGQLCEDLHDRGYHGVYLNTNCLIRHD